MAADAHRPFATFCAGFDPARLQGATVVVPVVSHANVPQLTVDLALATLPALERVAVLDPADLVPFVGAGERPLASGALVTPLELYAQLGDDWPNVFWLQQRSPVLKSRKDAFLRRFAAWVRDEARFGKLLVLGSVDGAAHDAAFAGAGKHYHLPLPNVLSLPFPALPALPAYPAGPLAADAAEGSTAGALSSSAILPPLPGSGLLSPLLLALSAPSPSPTAPPPQVAVILSAPVEGDNRADAHALARVVDLALDLGVGRAGAGGWREPESWGVLDGARGRTEWA